MTASSLTHTSSKLGGNHVNRDAKSLSQPLKSVLARDHRFTQGRLRGVRPSPACSATVTKHHEQTSVDIHSPYQLRPDQVTNYRNTGFVRLPKVFDATTLAHYHPTLSLEVANADKTPIEEDSDYQKAFTQVLL